MTLLTPSLSPVNGPGRPCRSLPLAILLLAVMLPLACGTPLPDEDQQGEEVHGLIDDCDHSKTETPAREPMPIEDHHVAEVRGLIDNGYYAKAETRARELLEDSEDIEPSRSQALARAEMMSHHSGALRRTNRQREPETLRLAKDSIEQKTELLGSEHPRVASGYYELGLLHYFCNELGDARSAFEHAIEIQEQSPGPNHPDTAMTLIRLAGVLSSNEKSMDHSIELIARARTIQEAVLPADHPDVAQRLITEGSLFFDSNYSRAKQLTQRGLIIRQKVLRPGHPLTTNNHRTLGLLLELMGDYAGARQHLEQSLELRLQDLGPEHPLVGASYTSLAFFLERIGDLEPARRLYQQALEILEAGHGPEHLSTLNTRSLLANVLRELGHHDEARRHYERCLALAEEESFEPKSELCLYLCGYGQLLETTGRFQEAAANVQRAVDISREHYGEDHLQTLISLSSLAQLNCRMGRFSEARDQLNRISEIQQKAANQDHLLMLETLNDLALAQAGLGEDEAALATALQAQEVSREHLHLTSRTLEARLALSYAASGTDGLYLASAIAARCAGQRPDDLVKTFDAVIHWRALVLDELVARNRSARASLDPELEALLTELRLARERLSRLTVGGGQGIDGGPLPDELLQAKKMKETAERALAEASAAFRREQESRRLGLAEIRAALPENSALVSYMRYENALSVAPGEHPLPSYLAFVISKDRDDVQAFPLGSARDIDGLVGRWRDALRMIVRIRRPGTAPPPDQRSTGLALRQKIWEPLAERLTGAKRVFIVPDGALHLVSFAALPEEDGGYLLEQGPAIHYLTAERDLGAQRQEAATTGGVLVMGAPNFGALPEDISIPDDRGNAGAASTSLDSRYAFLRFSPLPEAVQEAQAVASLWPDNDDQPVFLLTGLSATEAAFKALAPGSQAIHLATHAYFLDPLAPQTEGGSGEGARAILGLPETRVSVSAPGDNPLLRSGLALAGANNRNTDVLHSEDGILTAEEIAALDLSEVRMAVLSACDTGLGTIQSGEGVFGLRRAFRLAGVRTVVMSLWQVDDEAARFWMDAFYRSRLEKNMDMAQAVRQATLGLLEKRRDEGLGDHPFHWAAFVAAGDWR